MALLAAIVVVATLIAMTSGKMPPLLALACAIAFAGVVGLAPPAALFSGLSNGGVITVACMLVIAKGVVHTGVVTRVTWQLLRTVQTAAAAFARLVFPVGLLSALINTTPIVAMLIPAARELEQTRNIPARQVLLPIAHATTLAGSVTLIGTSSNLIIAGLAAPKGIEMTMLSFAPVALPVALVGWAVLAFTGPRMLRGASDFTAPELDWRVELPVAPAANAAGRKAADFGLDRSQEFVLTAIHRWDRALEPTRTIRGGDVLVYEASTRGVRALWGSPRFGLAPQKLFVASVGEGEHGSLRDLEGDTSISVVAAQTTEPLDETPAVPGATYFVTTSNAESLATHGEFALWQDVAGRVPQPHKTWPALAILTSVIISASFGLLAVEMAAFAGAVLMVVTRVLTPRSAVRALDWNVLFVLAGSVGLGAIVLNSGLADVLARAIQAVSGGRPVLVVVVFALTTTVLTNLVTNAAAASILTPVAISIALELGLDPITLLALIGTCISFTFINPFGHQSNMMVMRPGGYSTGTFAKFGIPVLTAGVVTVCLVGAWLI